VCVINSLFRVIETFELAQGHNLESNES
jgi:hypothetical protein